MKKLLLSTALLALTAGAALAADLPTRKEPLMTPPPPPPMWTGFYAGLNAGYGFGTNSNTQSVALASDQIAQGTFRAIPTGGGIALSGVSQQNQNGFIGGGQIGYNYQWGQNIVIGIEADMQGTGIRATSRTAGTSAVSTSYRVVRVVTDNYTNSGMTGINAGVDWMGMVRGRIGYLWTPTMLVYATGGLTYGGVYASVSQFAIQNGNSDAVVLAPSVPSAWTSTFIGGGARSQVNVGWNVGGGLEWMFMPNWSLKAEGLYWNMGNMNVGTAAIAAAPSPSLPGGSIWPAGNTLGAVGGTRVNYQGVIARMGVNYHFNFGGASPIVAKY